MKFTKILSALALAAVVSFSSCKPKDADIQKSVEEKIAGMAEMKDMKVSVAEGVVTLTGMCKDADCQAKCKKAVEDMGIKGVKSVVNNCTLAPVVPAPASVTVSSLAADVQQKIKDGLKDIKGITSIAFSDKGAVLMGEITKTDNLKLKQILGAAKVALDAVASKLTIK